MALLDRLGFLDTAERNRQAALLSTLIHPEYPGLLRSAPWGFHNQNVHSHDNLKAMFWLSKRLGMTFAHDWLTHGRKKGWNWNSEEPKRWQKNGTYWRFFGMIGQAMLAAGEHPDVLHMTALKGELLYGGTFQPKGRAEAVYLPYFMAKTLRGHDVSGNLIIDRWKARQMKLYPRGLTGALIHYGWKDHAYHRWYEGVLDV